MDPPQSNHAVSCNVRHDEPSNDTNELRDRSDIPQQEPSAITPEDSMNDSSLASTRYSVEVKPGFQHFESNAYYSDEGSQANSSSAHGQSLRWIPSMLRLGPLFGLAALLFSFLSLIVAYGILKGSDGEKISSWQFQPNVYLAILTAISNKAMAFAMVQGTVVTFWTRLLQGTTLGQLHRDWAFGLHVWKALAAGRHFNLLAIGCICATFVAIDGPLLQRASTVHSSVPKQPDLLQIDIAQEVPSYSTGQASFQLDPEISYYAPDPDFIPVMNDYLADAPMAGSVRGCPGTCKATIRAPALSLDLSTKKKIFRNFTEPISKELKDVFAQSQVIPHEREAFLVSGSPQLGADGAYEGVLLYTSIIDDDVAADCIGHVNAINYYLSPAIGEYDVVIENNVIHFAGAPSHPRIVARANNTSLKHKLREDAGPALNLIPTTLSGIAYAAMMRFYSIQGLISLEEGQTPGFVGGPNWFSLPLIKNLAALERGLVCAPNFINPRDQVIAGLNEVMFRTGLHFARTYDEAWIQERTDNGLEVYTNVTATPQSPVDVFKSDFHYFAAAAAIELFTILIILFTFYGWWRLGRNFTFSPLEIGKAFDATILRDAASNSNGREICRTEGERAVRYGIVRGAENPLEKIAITDENMSSKPVGQRRAMKEWYEVMKSKLPKRRRSEAREDIEKASH